MLNNVGTIVCGDIKNIRKGKKWGKRGNLKGETVLDPFLGSGTTLEECRKLERNGIGFELARHYEPEIKRKIRWGMKNIEGWKVG